MDRVDPQKLVEMLLAPKPLDGISFILAEDAIYERLAIKQLQLGNKEQIIVYDGKFPLTDCVDSLASASLFAPAQPAVVRCPTKIPKKFWEEESASLVRLPDKVDTPVYIFALPTHRETLKNALQKKGVERVLLCYPPSDSEALRCLELIAVQHPRFKTLSKTEVRDFCSRAMEHYANDLSACDSHFERMSRSQMSFDDALLTQTEITSFHVVDALARGDKGLLELRLQHCAQAGEEAPSILMACVYFFKQLLSVHAALEKPMSIKNAFFELHIPYPAQARLQLATKTISAEALLVFFAKAADIEMTLRTQKNGHSWLYVELAPLIS